MKIVIESGTKCQQFTTIFKNMKDQISEINIHFDSTKLYIQGMDGSQIGLVELVLNKDWFKSFDVDQTCILGLNCIEFFHILNCYEKEQELSLIFEKDGDHLLISFESDKNGICDKYFKLPLLIIERPILKIPDTEFSADLDIKSALFEKIITELFVFAEAVEVHCTEGEVSLKTTKNSAREQGLMDVNINMDDMKEYIVEEGLDLKLIFALGFLKWIVQFSKLSLQCNIHFKLDIPMKLEYKLENENYICFYLAPLINDYM